MNLRFPLTPSAAWVAALPCALGLALAGSAGTALAQASAPAAVPAATAASTTFAITGFEASGEVPLPAAEIDAALAPFVGPQGTLETLQRASSALEALFQARGFALHRVSLPAQDLGGRVRLQVVRFVVGAVEVSGNQQFSSDNIRRSIPAVREGETPNFRDMAVQTAIANESPSKQVQVTVKESEEADKIDIKMTVRDARPWTASLSLNNTGSNATGNDRTTLSLGHANLWNLDHQLSAALTTSLERSEAVDQLGLNYKAPLYDWGAVLGASYTRSTVVGNFGAFNSTGEGQTWGLSLQKYLQPEGGTRKYWHVLLDEKTFNVSKVNGVPIATQVVRKSLPLTVGLVSRSEADDAIWGYNLEAAVSALSGSGAGLADYRTEDARIQSAQWTALRAGFNYLAPFATGWLWSVRTQLQLADTPLIAGEQFGLGGASSVRGAAERAVTGDSGALLVLEVSTQELAPGTRLVGFADGGWVNSLNTGASTANKPATDQLSSVGLGLRINSRTASFSAEWAQLTSGATQPPGGNPSLPKAGNEKLHLNATWRF